MTFIIIIFVFLLFSLWLTYKNNDCIDIYVISMKNSLDRRNFISEHLKEINFNFFDAVDGRNMNANEKEQSEK